MTFKRDLLSQVRGSNLNPVLARLSWAWIQECLYSLKKSTVLPQQAVHPGRRRWVCAGGLATASFFPTHYIPGLIWPSRSYSSDTLTHASLPHSLLNDG